MRDFITNYLSGHNVDNVSEAKLNIVLVVFDDGLAWKNGETLEQNPKNPREWRSNKPPIIAVFPNAESDVRQYAQQNQLQLETIAGADLKALNVRGTPTMILVDKNGKVLDFWVGKLSEDEKRQVTNAPEVS